MDEDDFVFNALCLYFIFLINTQFNTNANSDTKGTYLTNSLFN